MYIGTAELYTIKAEDIILIYIKEKSCHSGLTALLQTIEDHKLNKDKIKIFNDINMNKYCIKIGYITFYKKRLQLRTIHKNLQDNDDAIINATINYDFRTVAAFRKKYTMKNGGIIQLPYQLGLKLMKMLINKDVLNTNNANTDALNTNNANTDNTNNTDNTDNTNKNINKNKNNIKTNIETDKNFNEENKISEIKSNSMIPIMIIMCDLLLKNPATLYDHIKDCKKCKITDNSNSLIRIFVNWDKIKINNINIISVANNSDFANTFDAYQIAQPNKNKKDINIFDFYYVYDSQNTYSNCIFIDGYIST
jgi:hypothetical protein